MTKISKLSRKPVLIGLGFVPVVLFCSWLAVLSHHTDPGKTAAKRFIQTSKTKSSPIPATKYIGIGLIPVTGLHVGATFYGALESPVDGKYIPSNLVQGGQKNGGPYNGYDDNGEGACDGKYQNLADQSTWAEDGMGSALGDLPCGTKLEIDYNGHSVVAEKADISDGGCSQGQSFCSDNGVERKIDIWWQTAKALCLSEQPAVVTIHVVAADTTTVLSKYSPNDLASYSVCH